MKKIIGVKDKRYLIETIITCLIICLLIGLCIYRFIENKNGISMQIVFAGLAVVGVVWLFIESKNAYKYLIMPHNLIEIDDEFIYINNSKDSIKISIKDIKEVKITSYVNKILSHESILTIKDELNEYNIKYLKDVKEVENLLKEL
ncbi:MAG: hypothetical protein IJB21_03500 [Bacilli bacterium]|nr:hypothetical protein [Bacilli bacterium]